MDTCGYFHTLTHTGTVFGGTGRGMGKYTRGLPLLFPIHHHTPPPFTTAHHTTGMREDMARTRRNTLTVLPCWNDQHATRQHEKTTTRGLKHSEHNNVMGKTRRGAEYNGRCVQGMPTIFFSLISILMTFLAYQQHPQPRKQVQRLVIGGKTSPWQPPTPITPENKPRRSFSGG